MRGIVVVVMALALGVQGCASARFSRPVETAVVSERPASTFGPEDTRPPRQWVKVNVRADYALLKTLAGWQMTFYSDFTDCEKAEVAIGDEFYLDGKPLSMLKWDVTPYRNRDVIIATYIEKADYDAHPRICLKAGGGNMAYMSIRSNRIRVK